MRGCQSGIRPHRRKLFVPMRVAATLVLLATLAACATPAASPPQATRSDKPSGQEAATPIATAKPSTPQTPAAAKAPLKKITSSYNAISGTQMAFWMPKEAGYFEKNGLDVNLILMQSASVAAAALVSGEAQISSNSGAFVVESNFSGSDLTMVAGIVNTMIFSLMVDPSIKLPNDLKGKKLGITKFGSATDFSVRYALKKWGLEPDKDVTILQIGGVPEILTAMDAKAIQGGVLSPPTVTRAKKGGYSELVDLGSVGVQYVTTAVVTPRQYLKTHREEVKAYLQAVIEGIHRYKTDKEFAMKVLAKYTKTQDPEVLEDTYNIFNKYFEPVPYVKAEAVQTILNEYGAQEPRAKTAKPDDFFDNSVLKEIEDSGFVKQLYNK